MPLPEIVPSAESDVPFNQVPVPGGTRYSVGQAAYGINSQPPLTPLAGTFRDREQPAFWENGSNVYRRPTTSFAEGVVPSHTEAQSSSVLAKIGPPAQTAPTYGGLSQRPSIASEASPQSPALSDQDYSTTPLSERGRESLVQIPLEVDSPPWLRLPTGLEFASLLSTLNSPPLLTRLPTPLRLSSPGNDGGWEQPRNEIAKRGVEKAIQGLQVSSVRDSTSLPE